jgi:hypothetical protein
MSQPGTRLSGLCGAHSMLGGQDLAGDGGYPVALVVMAGL